MYLQVCKQIPQKHTVLYQKVPKQYNYIPELLVDILNKREWTESKLDASNAVKVKSIKEELMDDFLKRRDMSKKKH